MGAGHVVVVPQRLTGPNGNRFLADIEVDRANDLARPVELLDALLKTSDREHPFEHPGLVFLGQFSHSVTPMALT